MRDLVCLEDVVAAGAVHDVGYTAFLQSKNDCFKIRGPGAFGDPAQLAAILGGAGILRFGLGDLSESGFVGLDLLEDFLGLGMSLLTLLIRGACGDIYLNMTEIDAGGLYDACLVLLVVFMQLVVADRRSSEESRGGKRCG